MTTQRDNDRIPRLRLLFEQLDELDPAERDAVFREHRVSTEERSFLLSLLSSDSDQTLSEDKDASEHPLDRGLADLLESTGLRRPDPWPGNRVGNYRLISPIGLGGMGSVWRAESTTDPAIGVAVKFAFQGSTSANNECVQRLDHEKQILTQLNHPGIVSLVDAGTSNTGIPYLVLQDLPGQHLDTFVAATRPSCAELRRMMCGICRALITCHRHGIVHADIKPSNLLVSRDGTPVLIDFGVAQYVDSETAARAAIANPTPSTPAYASPEIIAGRPATPASDVYAVGRIIQELAPSCADSASRKSQLMSLAAVCTDRDPSKRPRSADHLLEQIVQTASPTTRLPLVSILSIGLAGGLVTGLAAFLGASFIPRADVDAKRDDSPLMLDLSELHPKDVPGDADTIKSIGTSSQSADLRVLAADRYLAEDRPDTAREVIEALGDAIHSTTPAYRVVAGRVLLGLGRPGPALGVLEKLDTAELRGDDRTEHTYLLLLARDRLGHSTPVRTWETLQLEAEQQQLHELIDTVFLYRVAMGHTEPVRRLLGEHERVEQPLSELDPRLAEAMLILYMRLRACGQAGPLDTRILDAADRDIEERSLASRDPDYLRLSAMLVLARVASDYHINQHMTETTRAHAFASASRDDVPDDFRVQLMLASAMDAGNLASPREVRRDALVSMTTRAYGAFAEEVLGKDATPLPLFLRCSSSININRDPSTPDPWWWPPMNAN